MKIGVIGCGDISRIYLKNMTSRFPGLEVVGCCARTFSHAEARAREFGIRAMNFSLFIVSFTNPTSFFPFGFSASPPPGIQERRGGILPVSSQYVPARAPACFFALSSDAFPSKPATSIPSAATQS